MAYSIVYTPCLDPLPGLCCVTWVFVWQAQQKRLFRVCTVWLQSQELDAGAANQDPKPQKTNLKP